MSLFSPLLIICFDADQVATLAELARTLGYPDAHIIEGGLNKGIAALDARTTSPDYIIVDIGNRTSDVLKDFDDFALHCESNVRVTVIGSVNDILFYRELKQRGVLEYFTRPVSVSDMRSVLLQKPSFYQPQPTSSVHGTVLSFMSAASGDGASTLAANVAYKLAQSGHSTVLVDLDYQFGLISKSLDVLAPFGIRELFDHPERGLDQTLVNKMLVRYKDSLSIIASPGELRLLPLIRPELIRELIGILRSQFSFVVIDVPHVWTDWTAAALTYSDHVLMVAQLWLRSLTHASRLLQAWYGIGIARDDISLVINRHGAKFKEAITSQDFERICHHKISTYINNDVKAVTQAENNAKTLLELEHPGILQEQISQLAEAMVKRYQKQMFTQEPSQHFAGKKGLRALLEKRKG